MKAQSTGDGVLDSGEESQSEGNISRQHEHIGRWRVAPMSKELSRGNK